MTHETKQNAVAADWGAQPRLADTVRLRLAMAANSEALKDAS